MFERNDPWANEPLKATMRGIDRRLHESWCPINFDTYGGADSDCICGRTEDVAEHRAFQIQRRFGFE
jgi:hypothetical protein